MRDSIHSVLRSVPRGLTLGPSLAEDGQLGLWCVGRVLVKGTLLGLEEPDQINKKEKEGLQHTCQNVFKNEISDEIYWMKFACSTRNEKESNVSVLEVDGNLGLRVCRDVQPGTELLLWKEQEEAPLENEVMQLKACEISSTPNRDQDVDLEAINLDHILGCADPVQNATREDTNPPVKEKNLMQESRACNSSVLEQNGVDEAHRESEGQQCDEHPARDEIQSISDSTSKAQSLSEHLNPERSLRASSRLASKPRKVHSTTIRIYKRQDPKNRSDLSSKKKVSDNKDNTVQTLYTNEDSSAEQNKQDFPHFTIRERKYKCDECDKSFFQLCHLKKHKFTHQNQKPYLCTECGKTYSSQESFQAHLLMHRGQRPFQCQHCDKSYGLKRDLKEHQVLHSGEKPFVCDICGKAFARRPSLRVHREVHRTKEPDYQAPKVKCPECNKELSNSGSLRNHMRLHTGERPYVCQHCDKSFRQRGNLLGHMRIHTGEKPYKCDHCELRFSQVPELRRHLISHTGEVYLCPVCGKALRDPHTLRAHERLHTGDRPYKCEQCGKGYTMATKLRRHMKSHLEEKPHVCQVCGAKYTMMQSLQRHLQSHKHHSDSGHVLPTRGRPKRSGQKTEGEQGRTDFSSLEAGQAVAYVQASEDFTMVSHPEGVILDSGAYHRGTIVLEKGVEKGLERIELSEDVIEIIVSDENTKCIVVQEQPTKCIGLQEQEANAKCLAVQENDPSSGCTVVSEQDANSCLVILQGQDGLSLVAQTVEIETGL